MGNKKNGQKANVKFCIANGLSAENTFEFLKKSHYSIRSVYRWYNFFYKRGTDVFNWSKSMWRACKEKNSKNIDRVQELILGDRRSTVEIPADELNISKNVVHRNLTEHLKIKHMTSKDVPRILRSKCTGEKLPFLFFSMICAKCFFKRLS